MCRARVSALETWGDTATSVSVDSCLSMAAPFLTVPATMLLPPRFPTTRSCGEIVRFRTVDCANSRKVRKSSEAGALRRGRPMDRGLTAPLSPNEEVTLRRISYGVAKPSELIARDIEYLSRLALVDRTGKHLVLTELGRQRLSSTPGPHFKSVPTSKDHHPFRDSLLKR